MRIVLLFLSVLFFNSVFSQVSSVEMRGDFADAARLGRLQGAEGLPSYSSNNVRGTRYLTETWAEGSIVPLKGNTIDSLLVMFDKQDHNIYIKKKQSEQIILLEKNQVKSFLINNHFFIAGSLLPGGENDRFYEKIAGLDKNISLYKLTITKYIKADKTDLERIAKGNFDDEFKDNIAYYIKNGNQPLQEIRMTEKNIIKALPGQEKKIRAYFDDHYNEELNDQFLIGIINILNQ
ncbi:MAG: hypothetical protein ACJ748_09325 [Flavisolibacter sp.]